MNHIESINLDFNISLFLIAAGIIVFSLFTFLIYRYTVPPISKSLKIFLTVIRSLALILLALLIIEPVLVVKYISNVEPLNLLFIDNSKSIVLKDSVERKVQIVNLIEEFDDTFGENNIAYTFGSKIDSLVNPDQVNPKFDETITNFSDIFEFITKSNLNAVSAVIISDGVITDGITPINTAERLEIPVYSIGIGDTLWGNDINIKDVKFNEYIYAGKPTKIKVTILNSGFGNKSITVNLSHNSDQIDQRRIVLNSEGLNELELDYTPKTAGYQKLNVDITNLKDEASSENNTKSFFINVLRSKLKILIIAGSPSPDVSFIKNSLALDENLDVESIIEITESKFFEDNNYRVKLDSADVFYLIDFPAENSSDQLIVETLARLEQSNKPFFISFGSAISLSKLKKFQNVLPFNIDQYSSEFNSAQISIEDINSSLLKHGADDLLAGWNQLPPIHISGSSFSAKPGTNIIAKAKVGNIKLTYPLIISSKTGSRRSIALLGKDVWRWKLKAESATELFDHFFANSVKWLSTKNSEKQVSISTSKMIYQLGEEIQFIAQVYNDMFIPVGNADVNVKIVSSGRERNLKLSPDGEGIYTGIAEISDKGDYEFTGSANFNNKTISVNNGRFIIGDIDIESLNPKLNKEFLFRLSTLTNAKYYYINEHQQIFQKIKNKLSAEVRKKHFVKEINLWSSELLLLLLIVLFSVEWFLRKKVGML